MKEKGNDYATSFPGGFHATSIVEGVGMFLFALYHVVTIIVLVNMLIAMMSHSFEDIQVKTNIYSYLKIKKSSLQHWVISQQKEKCRDN